MYRVTNATLVIQLYGLLFDTLIKIRKMHLLTTHSTELVFFPWKRPRGNNRFGISSVRTKNATRLLTCEESFGHHQNIPDLLLYLVDVETREMGLLDAGFIGIYIAEPPRVLILSWSINKTAKSIWMVVRLFRENVERLFRATTKKRPFRSKYMIKMWRNSWDNSDNYI